MNKTDNAIKSILSGGINRVVSLLLPFIVRTAVIYKLGMDYLGLDSVFSSILNILSFAELGFGNVMVYSFYKPIAEKNTETVCALYNFYKIINRIIGSVMLIVGIIMLPFIERFVSGDYPSDVNLYVLYLIFLFNTVISYWLFAYKKCLVAAHQEYYISNNISLIVVLLKTILELVVLFCFNNYYAYIIILPITTVVGNLISSAIVDKRFPQYKCKGDLEKEQKKEIFKTVAAGIGHKLGPTATTSIDNLVISSVLGVTLLGIYSNYSYVQTSVAGFITIIFTSLTAGIGNSLFTKTNEDNYEDFKNLTFASFWLVGACTICLLCLYQPFMSIWVGTDKMLNGNSTIILLSIMFYTQEIRQIVTTYKSAAGLWRADKFKPYVATFLNLVLDIIFVRFWGINGVILTTIVARSFVGLPWETSALYKHLFKKSTKDYYSMLFQYSFIWLILSAVMFIICNALPFSGWIAIAVRLPLVVIFPNFVYYLIVRNTNGCRFMLRKLNEIQRKVFDRNRNNARLSNK